MTEDKLDDVEIYSEGMFRMSICVIDKMPKEEALEYIRRAHPSGTRNNWQFCSDKEFAAGLPNPCPCEKHEGRTHYLLEC